MPRALTSSGGGGILASVNTSTPVFLVIDTNWENRALPGSPWTSAINITFNATPSNSNADDVVGFSAAPASAFASLSCILRFNNTGTLDVYNGAISNYASLQSVPYSAGQTFAVLFQINTPSSTYDVFVTPPGGGQIHLASGYSFRAATGTFGNCGGINTTGLLTIQNLNVSAIPLQPPVVNSTSFGPTSPISSGAAIGTVTATNSPTSWSILSGDPLGDFAIDNSGNITAAQSITGTGSETLTVQATNSGGSGSGTAAINWAPGGTDAYASIDGSANAPGDTGNAQYTFFLNPSSIATPQANPLAKYHAVGQPDQRVFGNNLANLAPANPLYFQPPWMVAGIDFPVGIRPSALPLKLPTAGNMPAGASFSGTQITIGSSNVTLAGFDLSAASNGNRGINIFVNSSSLTGIVITDCYLSFAGGSPPNDAINCSNSGVTIQYCAIWANASPFGNSQVITDGYQFLYSFMMYPNQHGFQFGQNQPGLSGSNQGLFVKFSVMADVGYAGGHSNFYQPGQGNTPSPWQLTVQNVFNWQRGSSVPSPINGVNAAEGTEGWSYSQIGSGGTSNAQIIGNALYNTCISLPPATELSGYMEVQGTGFPAGGTNTAPGVTVMWNYIDVLGASSPFQITGTATQWIFMSNNYSMNTGLSDGSAVDGVGNPFQHNP